MTNEPHIPDESAWESAMSRDFDARVRHLDEAPLDLTDVKGKARTIRRNRRVAAAGGVLAVAAVITPIAVVAGDDGSVRSEQPDFAEQTDGRGSDTTAPDTTAPDAGNAADGVDHIVEGTWVRADGTEVELPRDDYLTAVVWDDQLVAQHRDGEDEWATTEVIGPDGQVVDSFETSDGLAVSDDRSVLAYVSSDGRLTTRWDGGEAEQGGTWASNDQPIEVEGRAPCETDSGACTVWVENGAGECRVAGSADVPLLPEGAVACYGTTADGHLVVVDEIGDDYSCGGAWSFDSGSFEWRTCKFQPQDVSPDGRYVAGPPSYFDGLGPMEMSILDARTGKETGRYAVDLATVTDWAWSDDNRLVMRVHDTVNWHLVALHPDGSIEEITDQVEAPDLDPPFTLVR